MDFFFNSLKKGLVATLFVVFAFVGTYIPQIPTSQVHTVEAGSIAGFGGATEITQLANNTLLGSNVVQNTINSGANVSNWVKENVLDGIGWAIAKRIVSGIVRSLIDWVNSGFQGSPSFIQDFGGFLRNIADEEIGRVINDLGGIGSFICSPFRLDVQVSVALQYSRSRNQQSAPTCTLSGVIDNIEGFINGVTTENVLRDWFTVTSQPEVYTPYGAALSAQATARARLINAQGEEIKLLDFGDGFLSQKLCRNVSGFTGSQDCSIVKPGRVIADQLNKALGAGQDSLVQADEINELIAALLGQLANKALTGVSGLLGLSGGDGFGGYASAPSYLDDLYDQSGDTVADSIGDSATALADAIAQERAFRNEAAQINAAFQAFTGDTSVPEDIERAGVVLAETQKAITDANTNITTLETMQAEYTGATDDERITILIEFTELNLTTEAEADILIGGWEEEADDLGVTL